LVGKNRVKGLKMGMTGYIITRYMTHSCTKAVFFAITRHWYKKLAGGANISVTLLEQLFNPGNLQLTAHAIHVL
jgi:hypothetical protein